MEARRVNGIDFDGDRNMYETNELLISSYLLEGYLEALKQIPLDSYIIGVTYDKKVGGDTQIFITGTKPIPICDTRHVMRNKLYEDSGLVINNLDHLKPILSSTSTSTSTSTSNHSDWHICNIANTKFNVSDINCDEDKQKTKMKSTCIVYGNYKNIMKIFNRINKNKHKPHNKNITGIVSIPLEDVCVMTQKIQELDKKYGGNNGRTKFYHSFVH
jgi:hypothetical protein